MKAGFMRKAHRSLGLVTGIQFLFWTLGGLYFSWSNIDQVHGDFNRKPQPAWDAGMHFISPAEAIGNVRKEQRVDSLLSLSLVSFGNRMYYSMYVIAGDQKKRLLADAQTGQPREALTKEEAVGIAREAFTPVSTPVASVVRIDSVGTHHEYREGLLPAYAVSFDHPGNTVVYVAAETGTIQYFRNNNWRVFDFLWMMHTMDFHTRDNINNLLLKVFSVAGLLTIISGLALFLITRRRKRKLKAAQYR